MAWTFRSQATTYDTNTVTAPAGIALGDLLVAVTWDNVTEQSGWTTFTPTANTPDMWIGWQIAEAADVGAANFTFANMTNEARAHLMCFAGAPSAATVTATVQVATHQESVSAETTETATLTTSTSLTGTSTLILNFIRWGFGNGLGVSATAPSVNGISLTLSDGASGTDSGEDYAYYAKYGITDTEGTYTGFSSIIDNEGSSTTGTNCVMASVVFFAQTDAEGTLTHLAVSPTLNSPIGKAGTTGTLTHLTVSPTLNSPSARADNRRWTNVPKRQQH